MEKSRGWIVVINNYTDADKEAFLSEVSNATYGVASLEVGESGTPHIQGYLYYTSQRRFSAMKKVFSRAHLECASGSASANRDYILHEGKHAEKKCDFTLLVEHGTMPQQGKRKSFEMVKEAVAQGKRLRDIVPMADSLQAIKAAEVLLKYNEPERNWVPEVRWYYGAAGTGKSRQAREWLGDDIYSTLDNMRWWDGYDAHTSVLIDDFRKSWCSFEFLLRLLDRYPLRVEVKGGTRQFLAKKIAITTTKSPKVTYEDLDEELTQLTRRITEIILVK